MPLIYTSHHCPRRFAVKSAARTRVCPRCSAAGSAVVCWCGKGQYSARSGGVVRAVRGSLRHLLGGNTGAR